MTDAAEFDRAVMVHDAALVARNLEIWVGNEPTFTDRRSHDPEWVTAALGQEKLIRAQSILVRLANEQPGCAVLRTIGRQYPGEATPRWCFGIYGLRDGRAVWAGPSDPLLAPGGPAPAPPVGPSASPPTVPFLPSGSRPPDGSFPSGGPPPPEASFVPGALPTPVVHSLQTTLGEYLASRGYARRTFSGEDDVRIVFARGDARVMADPSCDGRLLRRSIHGAPIPEGGLRDDLAMEGLFLVIISRCEENGLASICVELPTIDDVASFLDLLRGLGDAAKACGVPSLILRGFAPPLDATVSFTTVTPDPAVVEVNMAPHQTVLGFLQHNRRVYAAAKTTGLEPYRLHFNGTVVDSGGGGQITVGGPSPERSPFFVEPQLLARLIRYAAVHPALSYFFAHDYIGASGQSVRSDEHGAEALGELKLALALVGAQDSLDPATLWLSLAPSLTDPVGNSHRAEINIEKLWNPHQPGRGQLGLVEFRAFRMQHTPERAAALAALLRAMLAMLMKNDVRPDLADWGATLHDRFALPFYLEADLREVLGDLDRAGVGLARVLRGELETDECRAWTAIEFAGGTLTIRRALEFWSLLGDASHQQGTSRLVDASTSRVELVLRPKPSADAHPLRPWQLRARDIDLPLREERDATGALGVFGVRYRSFVPSVGLHPTLGAQDPVRLFLLNSDEAQAMEIDLHSWRPDGAAYDGVPTDLEQAAARRAARCVCRKVPMSDVPPGREAPKGSLSPYSLDLRYTSVPVSARPPPTNGDAPVGPG